MAIINSLLDTDFYKINMGQVVLYKFADTTVKYKFKCRTPGIDFTDRFELIADEVNSLGDLSLTEEEAGYLRSIRFLSPGYIEFLEGFRFRPERHVAIWLEDDGELNIEIRGPWLSTILYEVPVLAIVSECYTSLWLAENPINSISETAMHRQIATVRKLGDPGFKFADFGTRRRFSYICHRELIKHLASSTKDNFVGTSNVALAREFGVKPIGTMAHEFLQCHQAMNYKLSNFQAAALQNWADVYRGDLGIALSDTVGLDAFLVDFDLYLSKLFDGVRIDSGDPHEAGEKVIEHYEGLGIDPMTKTTVFSDGLTIDSAIKLYETFKDRIGVSFGIGTHLTNSFGVGLEPIQIVIKVVECNGQPVAKVSDSPGKQMCEDAEYIERVKKEFDI